MRVELVCAAWRHKRPENVSLVHALAGSGCAVVPSIGVALERETDSDPIATWLINALAEMGLVGCDSMEVGVVFRVASARVESITDSYDRVEARKKLAVVERMVSH
jgi:tartrate dehydratase alpha subunit/fumarate hydratase class I-like protein